MTRAIVKREKDRNWNKLFSGRRFSGKFWISTFCSKFWEKWWAQWIDLIVFYAAWISIVIKLYLGVKECTLHKVFRYFPFGEILSNLNVAFKINRSMNSLLSLCRHIVSASVSKILSGGLVFYNWRGFGLGAGDCKWYGSKIALVLGNMDLRMDMVSKEKFNHFHNVPLFQNSWL